MDNYERLQEILDAHPTGAPKSKIFDKILRILFTPEEVAVAVHMKFSGQNAGDIAAKAGLPVEGTKLILEAMASKVIIFSQEKNGERRYMLLPTIPGLFEFPFMKGAKTPALKELGGLWEEYHRESLGAEFAATTTPLMRVVPVEDSIASGTKVLPHEEVRHLVDQANYVAVTKCACRVSVDKCDKPREVCMIFGSAGKFLVERGFAREISKDEAYSVLKTARDAGLVHSSNNSADRGNMICNCCSCCCTVLRGKTQLNIPHAFSPSPFYATINSDLCTGCGICADERCPMGAIEVSGETASVSLEKCIGCGVCATECPSEAITLIERPERPDVPATIQAMATEILTKKGKLEKFLEVMKK